MPSENPRFLPFDSSHQALLRVGQAKHMPIQAGEVAMFNPRSRRQREIRDARYDQKPQAMPGLLSKPWSLLLVIVVSLLLWCAIILTFNWLFY
jgi:hypothetical protein